VAIDFFFLARPIFFIRSAFVNKTKPAGHYK